MWADAIKRQRVKVDGPQCGGLYKEDNESIIPWSGTDPDAKMNSFTWLTEENDWIFLGGVSTLKTSITGKDLITMVNSDSKILRR